MLRARRATTTTSTTPPKAPGVAGAPSRQSSLSPAAARSRAATLTQQSPPPSHSQRSQGVVSSSSPKPPQQPSAASPTSKAPPAASTASPVQRTASPAAASASSTSAAERYKLLMAKKAEAAASSSTMRAPSPTTTRARAMTLPANKSPLRPGAASSPTRTRIARLTKRLANLSKAAGRYQDALDVRLQSQVIAGEVRKMQTLLAETPSDQLLPSALQRVDALERQLRSTKSALSRHEESTAMLLLGVGRLTQLIHDVAEPLAAREDALSRLGTRAHAGPPRLRRVVDELHSITTDRVTEEMASWEELSTTRRAYKEACRLERIIYTELHDRVEAECLMQVHKSQTYESLYDGHKRELVMLNGELQRVTAVVKNNTIVMRRKGRLFDDDHHADATNSDEEEEPAAMEPTSVPKPTPMLTVDEFTSLKHSVEVLQREYREATETQKQHNTAFVEARRELERELARLQHQRKEAAKALLAQEQSFAYFEARVHGMDPNDKELPDLLEACVREASPETREASPDVDGEAPKDEHDEGGEGEGYVSAFRRHAPKKLYISSKRTVDDVRGPTIASIAREEASLETRIRADEVRRY
ncbi:Hypothetical protein, putative [Bodo saltans]|uniref:Uncharacterized protein n=1 Tax=Bodo saltans TaxID=75058 RepID=A0A0S4IQ80_BODSA|nr:Hypothetical protein, putative [Bodo saltans]|eukprot:CUF13068.1 Hypothetical protein, putative [Bodo saltans]